MKDEFRHLAVDIQEQNGVIRVRVTEQTHRWTEFTPTGMSFTASNNFIIFSSALPAYADCKIIYVRGINRDRDNSEIELRSTPENQEWCTQLLLAVREYNNTYGKLITHRTGYLKRNIKLIEFADE